ncbi:MAG: DUF2911 domain-containing protein [Bryobacterales bacterium]|nr:DUF2911 domain-containing protein [Bryobacterales bacterium]
MRKTPLLLITAAVAVSAAGLYYVQERKRVSPHEQTSGVIAGQKITIEYGRPYKKGRVIYGGLVPYGQVWRTGADEATKLTTTADLMIGSLHVPKGTYSLFTVPGQNEWTLVLNKVPDQMGAYNYDQKMDLGRTKMKVEKAPAPLEQLTISVESASGKQGLLKIAWDTTVASVPLTVH